MGKIIVGYKAKEDIHKGVIVANDQGHFEPIYKEQNPIEELAGIAMTAAYLRNDTDLSERVTELVAIIKGKAPKTKDGTNV